jgi:hypothetical protein
VFELMLELAREQGTAFVLVTHDESLAARCERQQHSRFYRVHHTPAGVQPRWSDLPVVDKRLMMVHFDDWVTDPRLTLERVRGFAARPGEPG